MKERPNYYAIIPANVRYDKELRANEKLMYGEITALSNVYGFCFASNNYFAALYKVTPQAISKWIRDLKDKGYIQVDFDYKDDTKEIDKRIIKIVSTNDLEVSTNDLEGINKCLIPHKQKFNDNIINNNNTRVIKQVYGEFQNVFLTDEEYQKVKEQGLLGILEELSGYIASSGKRYKSHYATILNWSRRKKQEKGGLKSQPSFDIDEINKRAILNDDFDI